MKRRTWDDQNTRANWSLQTVGTAYLAHLKAIGRRPTTIQDYESCLRIHLVPFFGARPLRCISPAQLETYVAHEVAAGCAQKSIKNYLIFLGGVFRYAMRHEIVHINPVDLIDLPQRPGYTDIRFLTLPELDWLLAHVPDDERGRTDRVIYLTAALTGIRRGELVALQWRDVDFYAGLIRVRRSCTRGYIGPVKTAASSRSIPLAGRLRKELEAHQVNSRFRDSGDFVFAHPTLGTIYDPSKLRKRFVAATQRAGLHPTRFHDLRHTFGTQAAAAGAPLRSIQAWLGHQYLSSIMMYVDYAPDVANSTRVLDRAFGPWTLPKASPHQGSQANRGHSPGHARAPRALRPVEGESPALSPPVAPASASTRPATPSPRKRSASRVVTGTISET